MGCGDQQSFGLHADKVATSARQAQGNAAEIILCSRLRIAFQIQLCCTSLSAPAGVRFPESVSAMPLRCECPRCRKLIVASIVPWQTIVGNGFDQKHVQANSWLNLHEDFLAAFGCGL